jgi:hypothetical protein
MLLSESPVGCDGRPWKFFGRDRVLSKVFGRDWASEHDLHQGLDAYLAERRSEFGKISDARKADLAKIADYVSAKRSAEEPALLTFICTHNSRRSHMSQLWAQTAAYVYGVEAVATYSGGTEATTFNPRAVDALERAGMHVTKTSEEKNPVYEVTFRAGMPPMRAFSKKYDDEPNPDKGFCAVMTCSDADAGCPYVVGAEHRVAIPFADPRVSDNTDGEIAAYDERCAQISREMLYIFSQVK